MRSLTSLRTRPSLWGAKLGELGERLLDSVLEGDPFCGDPRVSGTMAMLGWVVVRIALTAPFTFRL